MEEIIEKARANMRRGASLLLAALLLLSLAGCGGVPEEEYNAVRAERDALQAELLELKNSQPPEEPEEREYVYAKISGTFTATVCALLPDNVTSFTTPMTAAVHAFQSPPFVIYSDEITEQLEVGKTYVFEIKEEIVRMTWTAYEYAAQEADLDDVASMFFGSLRYSVLREAGEGDIGCDSVDLTVKLLE